MRSREPGSEQPYWPAGPFKIRLPFVHARFERPEAIQALIMSVVGLAIIPLLETYLGVPYDAALAITVIAGFIYMLAPLLGVPLAPGWITPSIPFVLLFLGGFDPGPDAMRALVALQLLVAALFFILGLTGLGARMVQLIPPSLQAGILLGAGIAAILGEITGDGRLASTPIAIGVGGLVTLYVLFSGSFQRWVESHAWAKTISSYGMVPGTLIAIAVGCAVREYPIPEVQFGLTQPDFNQLLDYLPFTLGLPGLDVFVLALPTALIAYVIAFGDIVVGKSLINRVDHLRPDEDIEVSVDRVHLVTGIRNLIHAMVAPLPTLAGPLFTGIMATIAERYRHGRSAMDSIYGGLNTYYLVGFVCLLFLPIITFFRPFLPIALSITLLVTGFVCIQIAVEKLKNPISVGVAGSMGAVLAATDALIGLATGVVLYVLLELGSEREDLGGPSGEPVDEPLSPPE